MHCLYEACWQDTSSRLQSQRFDAKDNSPLTYGDITDECVGWLEDIGIERFWDGTSREPRPDLRNMPSVTRGGHTFESAFALLGALVQAAEGDVDLVAHLDADQFTLDDPDAEPTQAEVPWSIGN